MKTIPVIKAIILLFLITAFSRSYSQNYRILQPGQTTLYTSTYGPILGMRVDSVGMEGNDTVFYLLKNLQQMDWNCYLIDGPSWMGDRVKIHQNGETIFYNAMEQPVLIKTLAVSGEAWMAYSTVELSFQASIASVGFTDILGLPDSVKTISFQAQDADGVNIDHEVNSLNLILSKNHGMVKTLNFFNFPDFYLGGVLQNVCELSLSGIDNPETGIQNLTWKEVHNHNIGDELHTVFINSYAFYYSEKETIARLIGKNIQGDTTVYLWENKVKISTHENDSNTFTAFIDTITEYITLKPEFDMLPGEAGYYIPFDAYNTTIMNENIHGPVKTELMGSILIQGGMPGDSCYTPMIICGCIPGNDYYKGLGGPYFYCNMGIDSYTRELVYYKKDGVEWGDSLNFTVNTSLLPIDTKPEIVTIFPNPAQNLVNITFKDNHGKFRLQIIDNSGRELTGFSLKGETNTIVLSHLKPGIYLLRISTENQFITKRIVKL